MSNKKMVLVDNLANCKKLFSVVNKDDDITIVTPERKYHRYFFDILFPKWKKRYITSFTPKKPEPGKSINIDKHLEIIYKCKKECETVLQDFSCDTDIYYFNPNGHIFVFIMLEKLRNIIGDENIYLVGMDKYHNGSKRSYAFIDDNQISDNLRKSFLQILRTSTGLYLSEIHTIMTNSGDNIEWNWPSYGFNPVVGKTIDYDPLDWNVIKSKFVEFEFPKIDQAALYIDSPIEDYPGIVLDKSKNRLADFLYSRIKAGKQLYIKPHYRKYGRHTLENTIIDGMSHILPAYMPVEFYMDSFSEIYLILSSSGAMKVHSEIKSLLSLLCFDDDASKRFQYSRIGLAFGNQKNEIAI